MATSSQEIQSSKTESELQRQYYLDGVFPIILASVIFAFSYFFRKTVLADCSSLLLTCYTATVAGIYLTIRRRLEFRQLWKSFTVQPFRYVSLTLCGVVVGTVLMFYGLQQLDLGVALVLEKLQTVLTVIIASCLLHEELSKPKWVWAGVAVLASYFVVVPDPTALKIAHSTSTGALAVVGAASIWAVSTIIGRIIMLNECDPIRVTQIRYLLGSLFLLPALFVKDTLHLRFDWSPYTALVVVLSGILSTGWAHSLYYRGLRHVQASTTSLLELVTPVIGVLLGVIFLDETLSRTQLLAMPVVLISVYFIARRDEKIQQSVGAEELAA